MASLMELRQAAIFDQEQEKANNPFQQLISGLGSGFDTGFTQRLKEQEDEKRRQENVKKQISEAQRKMQAFAEMKDNSASTKSIETINDDVKKRQRGVMSVDDYTFDMESPLGYRPASPAEQKVNYERRKLEVETLKAQERADILNKYKTGKIDPGVLLLERENLGITTDDFDAATQERNFIQSSDRLRQVSQQQTFSGQPTQIPVGRPKEAPVLQQTPILKAEQPQLEQPFQFKQKEPKAPTMAQETTGLYAGRIKQANEVFDSMESYLNDMPVVGTALSKIAPNFMKDEKFQAYEQAKKNFLNAVLRRESGAVISPSEFVSGDQQYFPQPGDKPEVLAQKKANRDLVMKNFIKSAGSAYVEYENPLSSSGQSGTVPRKVGRFLVEEQ